MAGSLRAVLLLAALAVPLIGGSGAGGITYIPPNSSNVKWWLGTWDTNFGKLFFADTYRAKSDVPDANGDPQYYWSGSGSWTMPDGKTVSFKGAFDARDHLTWQGCYTTYVKGRGSVCYPMLLYGSESGHRITHGYWKPCFIPESCKDHHPWTGTRNGREWRMGFRFTQRGFPDGEHTIRTQTGGAGTIVWPSSPVGAGRRPHGSTKDRGMAVHGSALFSIDEIDTGNLTITLEVKRGYLNTYATPHEQSAQMTLEGNVTSSNDPKCNRGNAGTIVLYDRPPGKPDRIFLNIGGCRLESWTSTDPNRVRVVLERPAPARG